ncbi:MAG: hypothetical protein Q9157_000252 [Trypethelium eluteriae]
MNEELLCDVLTAVPTFEECLELAKSTPQYFNVFCRHIRRLMDYFLAKTLPDPQLGYKLMAKEVKWEMRYQTWHRRFNQQHEWWLFMYQRLIATSLDLNVLFHKFQTLLHAVPDAVPVNWRFMSRRDFDVMFYSVLTKIHTPESTWSLLMHTAQGRIGDHRDTVVERVIMPHTFEQLFKFFKFFELLGACRADEAYREPMGEVGSRGMSIWQSDGVCGKFSSHSYGQLKQCFDDAMTMKSLIWPEVTLGEHGRTTQ